MKLTSIGQIVETFFRAFGMIQFLYLMREISPQYGGVRNIYINDRDCIISIAVAILYTIMHTIITSETLDNKISMKVRVWICIIPSLIMGGLLTVDFSLYELLWWFDDTPLYYMIEYEVLMVASVLLFFCAYWWTESRYIRIGKEYDKALAEYKEKMNNYELLELKENEENIK